MIRQRDIVGRRIVGVDICKSRNSADKLVQDIMRIHLDNGRSLYFIVDETAVDGYIITPFIGQSALAPAAAESK
jgi:hypothetical protein